MAKEVPGLLLHFTQQVINVQWGGLHFLYSGADGMFGSENGDKWQKLETGAVPATGLAWVDDVWVATGSGGPWRSEDGGKTWESAGANEFTQIAACKPDDVAEDADGQPIKNGIFAGYKQDEDGDNEQVYISRDLGKNWSIELSIPTTIPAEEGRDGSEFAQVLSGCGNGIFLSTMKQDTRDHHGDGCIYVSMNGGGFGGRQQIWTGSFNPFVSGGASDPHTIGYSPGAVGFDAKTKQFCLMASKEEGFGPGGALGSLTEYSIIYATGLGGSFSGEAEIIKRTKGPLDNAFPQVTGGLAAAGGDGKFAGTYNDLFWPNFASGPPLVGQLMAVFFGSGDLAATSLISVPNMFGELASAQVGPVCWKPPDGSSTTDPPTGTFACVAFGADAEPGGVWIIKDAGAWQQTHNGQGFTDNPRAGLAVGSLSWLGSDKDA